LRSDIEEIIFTNIISVISYLIFLKTPDCHSCPMNMAESWMQNAEIVDIPSLDQSKTKIKLLALGTKKKGLYTQIYYFVFHNKKGNTNELSTINKALYDECSIS
jgi:adenine-specific DNA glycosylase